MRWRGQAVKGFKRECRSWGGGCVSEPGKPLPARTAPPLGFLPPVMDIPLSQSPSSCPCIPHVPHSGNGPTVTAFPTSPEDPLPGWPCPWWTPLASAWLQWFIPPRPQSGAFCVRLPATPSRNHHWWHYSVAQKPPGCLNKQGFNMWMLLAKKKEGIKYPHYNVDKPLKSENSRSQKASY